MKTLRDLSCAFSGGVVGTIALLLAKTVARGIPTDFVAFKHDAYRLMIWGGIWAFLLILPLFKERWFVRGSIVALAVILFNFTVLMPLTGKGFFAANAGITTFVSNIVFNYIWGVVAALWYHQITISSD